MRMSKTAYYADFAIYAAVLGVLILVSVLGASWTQRLRWSAAFLSGAAGWTLLEYVLHRFVLHGRSTFAAMHAVHHSSPRAYVGTPTWATMGIIWLVFFVPAWHWISWNAASGLTAGIMMGFWVYAIMHHVIHYRRPRMLAAWLPAASRRHLRHHFSGQSGNFGVSIPIWDYVFRTAID